MAVAKEKVTSEESKCLPAWMNVEADIGESYVNTWLAFDLLPIVTFVKRQQTKALPCT